MARPYRLVGELEVEPAPDSPGGVFVRPTGRVYLPWGETVTAHFEPGREYRIAHDGDRWNLYVRTA